MAQTATDDETVTTEERAKFYLNHALDHITPMELLGDMDGDTAEQNLRCLEIQFHEGVRMALQNKRELGWSPVNAWNSLVESQEYPLWLRIELAESEHATFDTDPDFMSEREIEYRDYLADEYDVPR